jgi:hypothetical protein
MEDKNVIDMGCSDAFSIWKCVTSIVTFQDKDKIFSSLKIN